MFDYLLPKERIAARPLGVSSSRDSAKLLHVSNGEVADSLVLKLPELLRKGDVLVFNDTKVKPYRFFPNIKDKICEILLVNYLNEQSCWECLARPMKRFKEGFEFSLSQTIAAKTLGRNEAGDRLLLELSSKTDELIADCIEREGSLPIPPYIRGGHSDELDVEFYQTIFATTPGSIAAPTAGLHFTKKLLEDLATAGVEILTLTLHVGVGSFLPINESGPMNHTMVSEQFLINEKTRSSIAKAKKENRRIIAVGTTTVRALEGKAKNDPDFFEADRLDENKELESTNIFIQSGFDFKVVDSLFTNFHQPRSTHLSLVSAFVGVETIKKAYTHALASDYRFLSYGDAMFLDV